jgi:DNA-binding NarL/FixJ family response regulator
MRNKEIAQVLEVSEQDVKNRLRRVFDKLGVWSRLELAMYVVNHDADWPS